VQDLLHAARPLGDGSLWAHGLWFVRRKPWITEEVSFLSSKLHGNSQMLPFCRIKHVYCVADTESTLASEKEYEPWDTKTNCTDAASIEFPFQSAVRTLCSSTYTVAGAVSVLITSI
jgi:hypothetical protein